MKKIRVLLVADSAVIRKVLGTLIASDSHSEVVGTGANGRVALEQLELLQPVREIRERGSQVPIIMCSSLTATGARRTLDSLPSAVLSVEETAPKDREARGFYKRRSFDVRAEDMREILIPRHCVRRSTYVAEGPRDLNNIRMS